VYWGLHLATAVTIVDVAFARPKAGKALWIFVAVSFYSSWLVHRQRQKNLFLVAILREIYGERYLIIVWQIEWRAIWKYPLAFHESQLADLEEFLIQRERKKPPRIRPEPQATAVHQVLQIPVMLLKVLWT
jgi:hypothetical protein